MIDQKFNVVFQILQPPIIPQKCFSAQNAPLYVRSQMTQTPTMEASDLWRSQTKTMMQYFENTLKDCTMVSVYFFKNKSSHGIDVSKCYRFSEN